MTESGEADRERQHQQERNDVGALLQHFAHLFSKVRRSLEGLQKVSADPFGSFTLRAASEPGAGAP